MKWTFLLAIPLIAVGSSRQLGAQSLGRGAALDLTGDQRWLSALQQRLLLGTTQVAPNGFAPLRAPQLLSAQTVPLDLRPRVLSGAVAVGRYCPMPVATSTQRQLEVMPVAPMDSRGIERMPVAHGDCTNPLSTK